MQLVNVALHQNMRSPARTTQMDIEHNQLLQLLEDLKEGHNHAVA
jgi:hypothetical protein